MKICHFERLTMQINPSKSEAQKPGRANGPLATNQKTPTDGTPENRAALVIAQLTKAGHHVHRLENNGFLVANWGYSLHCPGLAELQGFARKVGAAQ